MINSVRIASIRKKKSVESDVNSHNGGDRMGDNVIGVDTDSMYHSGSLAAVKKAQYSLSLLLTSPDSKGEPGNAIQQVGLTPEASSNKPKVSLVIGPKRSLSCEAINRVSSSDGDTNDKPDRSQGKTYMRISTNKTIDTNSTPLDRSRSKTLPRNTKPYAERTTPHTTPHTDYSSRSLPRKLQRGHARGHENGHTRPNENGHTHPQYSSQSLPRSRTKSETESSSKTPAWYREMTKEMNTSREKESNLSRLLASDVKRGVTSPQLQRSGDRQESVTYEDAPRRLRDARSTANQPHRKSLPNIHAANFNFMADHNKNNMNKNVTKTNSSDIPSKPRGPHSPRWESLVPAPNIPPDLLPNEIDIIKPKTITVEYSNPPDFLELRKQEIKNRDVEKEREEIRRKREKERLIEEQRLLEQKTKDFIKIEEERRRLLLKEEELELKEKLLSRQQKEHEERRLQKSRDDNLLRREEEERTLKLKEEEIRLKESEEMRLLKLKEEELKRKEEMLLKQEKELKELRLLKSKEEERRRIDLEERHRLREEEERKIREAEEERLRKLKVEEERKIREAEEELLRKLMEEEERKIREAEEERLRKLKEEEERKIREAEEERLRKLKEEEEREELERQRLEKLKQEELERKEEEKRILELKEELKRKEEELLRKEAEQRERQRLHDESLKPKLPPFGKAKYSFHPQGSRELEFIKGEIITIIEAVDENWIQGELRGKVGIFPISYVDLLDTFPGENIPEVKSKQNEDIVVNSIENIKDELNPDRGLDSKYLEPSGASIIITPSEEHETKSDLPVENGSSENNAEISENIAALEELILESTPEELTIDTDTDDIATSCQPKIEPGIAYAKYTFKAETESELSFKKGDEIVILKRVDDNWYAGECNGEIGLLPVNYVKVEREPVIVETTPEPEEEPIVVEPVGLAEKENKTEEDLATVNDYQYMNGSMDELIGQGDPHKAIYRYAATNEDEIELRSGDIVRVLEKCEDNWYIGTCERTGAFGTFPGNYVVPVH